MSHASCIMKDEMRKRSHNKKKKKKKKLENIHAQNDARECEWDVDVSIFLSKRTQNH